MNLRARTQPTPTTPASEPTGQSAVPRVLVLSDEAMRQLLADGRATPLSRIVTSFARYNDQWWLDAAGEWLAITDHAYAAKLDALAAT